MGVLDGVLRGHEAAPLVIKDTMYVVIPYPNILYALDLQQSGAIQWAYEPRHARAAQGVACCDMVNRGAAYGDGKIFFHTLDNHTVAVDAESGFLRNTLNAGRCDVVMGLPGASRPRSACAKATMPCGPGWTKFWRVSAARPRICSKVTACPWSRGREARRISGSRWVMEGFMTCRFSMILVGVCTLVLALPALAQDLKTNALPSAEQLLEVPVSGNPVSKLERPTIPNPYAGDISAIAQGRALFDAMNCSGCHAAEGGGGMGPPLSDGQWIYGGQPADIYLTIAQGWPNGMPAWGEALPPQAIWELVAYIQTLGASVPAIDQRPAESGAPMASAAALPGAARQ